MPLGKRAASRRRSEAPAGQEADPKPGGPEEEGTGPGSAYSTWSEGQSMADRVGTSCDSLRALLQPCPLHSCWLQVCELSALALKLLKTTRLGNTRGAKHSLFLPGRRCMRSPGLVSGHTWLELHSCSSALQR